jgi:hypothetical protein
LALHAASRGTRVRRFVISQVFRRCDDTQNVQVLEAMPFNKLYSTETKNRAKISLMSRIMSGDTSR